MAKTFYDIMYEALDEVGALTSGVATSDGNAGGTTVVDTHFQKYRSDEIVGGLLFAKSSFAEVASISGSTVTLATALAAKVSQNDIWYLCLPKMFDASEVKRLVNRAIQRIGLIPKWDSSITAASSSRDYALPASVHPQNLRRVYIETVDVAGDLGLKELTDWDVVPGATNELVLQEYPWDGKTLYLQYMGEPTALSNYNDTLDDVIPRERAIQETVYRLFLHLKRRGGQADSVIQGDLNHAAGELEEARKNWPILDPGKPMRDGAPMADYHRSRPHKYGSRFPA